MRVLPGFRLTLGFTLFYLGFIGLIPLAAVFIKTSTLTWAQFSQTAFSPQALAAYRLSFGASFFAAVVNAIFGLIVAWVLVRYNFLGKKLVDALVDLPFALPTAVAGITLATLYSPNGWIGHFFGSIDKSGQVHGLQISYTQLGIFVALTFIGLPFIVRTVQPVLEDFDPELEDAAASLGANRWQIATRVILPVIFPAVLTGFALAFARGVGEYGSVIFIAGNIAYVSEIAPLLIIVKLEEYDYDGATAIAAIMLAVSFVMLFVINATQSWSRRRLGHV